ncbi:hypothetical protein [Priestia megaterium]|uniref:hypothetical protein n=1 Tax=Priestia megaterium TaxID=1404 RepID=UPI0030088733
MGNRKKQNRKRPELNINELFKRIKFESKQIHNTFKDIEELLKRSKELMQQLLTAKNNGLVNGNTFFDVAAAPAIPTPPPAVPPPVTPLVQIVTKDIARIARQIRILQRELHAAIVLAISAAALLRRVEEEEEEEEFNEELATIELLAAVTAIDNALIQLQELRAELNADIGILLGIAAS